MKLAPAASAAVLLLVSFALLSSCGGFFSKCNNCPPLPTSFLYVTAVNDVSQFSLATSGAPTVVASQSGPNSSQGIAVDHSSKFLYVSDFSGNGGSLQAFTISSIAGVLTTVPGSPFSAGGFVGGLAIHPGSKFLYVTLVNGPGVAGFTIDSSSGALSPITGSPFPAVNTPMQAAVDPSGKYLYVSNLNDSSGAISAYAIDASTGALSPVAGSPFPTQPNFPGPDGLAFGASGKFLYVGMGGTANPNNVVSAFSIDSTTGALTQLTASPFSAGNGPSRVATDPAGKFLFTANLHGDTVSAFTIDGASGNLTPITGSPFASPTAPAALTVDPTGAFLYVANSGSGDISAFSIAANGALSPIAGAPFPSGQTSLSGLAVAKP